MEELIKLMGYSGPAVLVVFAGLVWGQKLIHYFFDEAIELKKMELNQDLEKYKGEIDKQSKDFQHSLDTKLNEFNIRFSQLHQDRATIFKQLYHNLVELQSAMIDFTRRMHPVIADAEKEANDRLERVNKALDNYNNFYIVNGIYFSKEILSKLKNISKQYWDKGWDFAYISRELKSAQLSQDIYENFLGQSREISKTVDKEFTILIEELEDEFRKILGVE